MRLNAYYCANCWGYVITEDVDEGVTPMFLACRVKGEPDDPANDCKGTMHSMMYPKQPWPATDGNGKPIPTEPTWEWYKPDDAEMTSYRREGDVASEEHVRKGGLMLRRKEPAA